MKVLFFVFHECSDETGVSKKIRYQVEALKKCGAEVHLCSLNFSDNGAQKWIVNDKVIDDLGTGFIDKIKKNIDYSEIYNYIVENKIDLLYIRSMHNANPFLNSFFKKVKKKGVKIVIEMPTYPYDQEYKDLVFVMKFRLAIDKCFRRSMAKQISGFVVYSNDKSIWNAPTINISNGVNFDAIKVKGNINTDPDRLNLIAVAEIRRWHGFDRLIWGMVEYYKTPQKVKVHLDIIGRSGVYNKVYEKIVRDHNLHEYIHILGAQYGSDLDKFFEQADFGIGSLARHRSHITSIKTLKNREYAARGIPFIYSEIDYDFENMPYVMKVSPDETPINIQSLIDFYRTLKITPKQIRDSIKDLSWENQMRKILNAVESNTI